MVPAEALAERETATTAPVALGETVLLRAPMDPLPTMLVVVEAAGGSVPAEEMAALTVRTVVVRLTVALAASTVVVTVAIAVTVVHLAAAVVVAVTPVVAVAAAPVVVVARIWFLAVGQ